MPKYLNPRASSPYGGPAEVSSDAWPEPHWTARAGTISANIVAYFSKWKDHPALPARPYSERHGDIFLPDLDEAQSERDEIPRYRLRQDGVINATPAPAGHEFDFAFWPLKGSLWNFEPINDSARRVHRYRLRYGNVTVMPGIPYDQRTGRLVLPLELFIPSRENPPASVRTVA